MLIRRLAQYLGLVSLLVLAFGVGYISYPLLHTATEPVDTTLNNTVVAGTDMNVFWAAWNLMDRDFYGKKPSLAARTYGAIRGMVETFNDPYTYFVEPQPRKLEKDELSGKFGGIGANLELSADGYVLRVIPDQPAAQAGAKDGDILLLVDDHEITATMSVDDIAALIRGPVDSYVTLVIRRRTTGQKESVQMNLRIKRTEIHTPSVQWHLLDSTGANTHVGYIQQTIFTERSPDEMRTALKQLTDKGANSFILDLRGNPGGLVNSAVDIADMWLDKGLILVEERADGTTVTMEAKPGTVIGNAPLAVIVDGGSASASEILAGALQDHERAILVGEKTYGKGSVQLIHELPDHSSLHVTNAQWFTPNHHQITGRGLTPDVLVAQGVDPLPQAIAAVQKALVSKTRVTATHD